MPVPSLKKVLWRCRRGTKELDIILGGFARNHFEKLNDLQKQQFDLLLDVQDPILTEWLCQNGVPSDEFSDVVKEVISNFR